MKNIIVTGAANGLGKAILEALNHHAPLGYDIKLNPNEDVAVPAFWLREYAKGDDTKLDVLINCAGINDNRWFEEVDMENFYHVMNVNTWGIVAMTQTLLAPLKRAKGTVINIVSNAAHMPMTSSLAYNCSKAAALMATKQMAHELTPRHGITVFSISPNKLEGTEMSKEIENNVCRVRGWEPEFAAEYQKKSLMHGRETKPEAVAQFIAHLIDSGNMQYMSGTDIPFGK